MTTEDIFKHKWITVYPTLDNLKKVLTDVPSSPGLYEIITNTPKEVLKAIIERNDKRHYDFEKKIEATDELPDGSFILQKNRDPYIVYNGHHGSLKQRCREHFRGSKGTGCLAIFEIDSLHAYTWKFHFLDLSTIPNYRDSKTIRSYLEQYHRSQIGWPILCSQ